MNGWAFNFTMGNECQDIVEGAAFFKMETDTASSIRAGDMRTLAICGSIAHGKSKEIIHSGHLVPYQGPAWD